MSLVLNALLVVFNAVHHRSAVLARNGIISKKIPVKNALVFVINAMKPLVYSVMKGVTLMMVNALNVMKNL
jgi:hypothetical protein